MVNLRSIHGLQNVIHLGSRFLGHDVQSPQDVIAAA
jgi:hypothetical protein